MYEMRCFYFDLQKGRKGQKGLKQRIGMGVPLSSTAWRKPSPDTPKSSVKSQNQTKACPRL